MPRPLALGGDDIVPGQREQLSDAEIPPLEERGDDIWEIPEPVHPLVPARANDPLPVRLRQFQLSDHA
jgi:hypothetical protein